MQFSWIKLGQIFDVRDVQDRWFMKEFAQAPSTLVRDDYVRVFFSTRPLPDHLGQYKSYSTFLDLDRNDLTRIVRIGEEPLLPLGALGAFDEFGVYPFSAVDCGNKVVGYYGGWTRCRSVPFNVSIGFAESYDNGETFKRIGGGPVLGPSAEEPFVISGPKIRWLNGLFVLYYIAGHMWILDDGRPEPLYSIRMATSTDGQDWDRHNRDLIPRKLGFNEAQASPDVFFLNNQYHMFFCFRHGTNYRGNNRGYRLGYAWSNDMINWNRNDIMSDLTTSAVGWDSESVSYPHVFELDGDIYMLYLGNGVGRNGFGLAIMRK